ncbi:hypothetical protein RJ55_02361 [Drechmeria coniospora]|nr:hypothetical protein RJ55_02361 [Drechmeria coniospora]
MSQTSMPSDTAAPARRRPGRSRSPDGFSLTSQQVDDQVLTIWADEDFEPRGVRPRRAYYGNNVPALGDISNGQSFSLLERHRFVRDAMEKHHTCAQQQNWECRDFAQNVVQDDRISFEEQVTGVYDWTYREKAENVWDWIVGNKYDESWTEVQKVEFRRNASKDGNACQGGGERTGI